MAWSRWIGTCMDSRVVLAGRYELQDRLGQGGMSVVWQARDLVLNRDVAVKMLTTSEDEVLRSSVQSEALAAARLAHPHVARVFDYGEADSDDGRRTPYIVMELLEGTPLSEATPMPPRQALQICAEIASALAAAHAQGVVHCDVKPGNVMLTDVGAKVFDFGIASTIAATDDDGPIDEVVGTPAYLAPEQLTGHTVTPATDVYALGVLLYALLMQRVPWSASTEAAMVAAHLLDDPADLPAVEGVTQDIATLYRRCLARDPAGRPAATELAVVLAEAARALAPLEPSTGDLSADTVRMAPVGIETALLWAGSRPAASWRRWQVAAMLLAAGSVAVAVAYTAVDATSNHVWRMARPPAEEPDAGRVAHPEIAGTDPIDRAAPPTTEPAPITPTPTTTPTTTPAATAQTPAGEPQTFASAAGAVVAGCDQDRAYLVSWTPMEGFKPKNLVSGPASTASVELRKRNVRIVMTVTCRSGEPEVTIGE
jgi:eukaryotic-like serine/threonine-protein kinase